MNHSAIIEQLKSNKEVFKAQLFNRAREEYTFKPTPDKWCMLEVLCHLIDEEKEDFRTRVQYLLQEPGKALPTFDPTKWPAARNYLGQDYETKVTELITERSKSVEWLTSLTSPDWQNTYQHQRLGPISAELFLANWLAHDYIHIRQLNRLAFEYLSHQSENPLLYAGNF